MPDRAGERREREQDDGPRTRGFWSGTISFGLVSIPVDLHPAVRPSRVPLRTLGPDGRPLSRRYFCPEHGRELGSEEIVKGYPSDDGTFIEVTDEELESVEPERSRDIDLRRFVSLDELDPMLFDRPYVLAPAGQSTKAYHLLVDTIQRRERAGIATFVMRGKEHLAAIFARDGSLRATILRFVDEVRTAEDVGLPAVREAPSDRRRDLVQAVKRLEKAELGSDRLRNEEARLILELAERKRAEGRDVYRAPAEVSEEEPPDNVVDIMRLLKERIAAQRDRPSVKSTQPPASTRDELSRRTKKELYERAKALDIEGRSNMSKEELIAAIGDAAA